MADEQQSSGGGCLVFVICIIYIMVLLSHSIQGSKIENLQRRVGQLEQQVNR